MLFFGPARKWGELLLGLLAITVLLVAAGKMQERRR
jgi:hypothetical protein